MNKPIRYSDAPLGAIRVVPDFLPSPEQLALRFEREGKLLSTTAGARWRAYGRLHRVIRQDDEWSERLFAGDFAKAYEEQVRLIATLNNDLQG